MGKKLNLIEKNQDKLKEIINNNNKEINQINKEIYNNKDSLEKVNKDIILIEQSQKNMKNSFNDEILKINSLELNQSKLEKKREDNVKNINESLKKALKEIELLKNKINENEKDIKIFKEKIKKLEEEKIKKSEEKEDIKEVKKEMQIKKLPIKEYSSNTFKREYNRNNNNYILSSRLKQNHYKNLSLLTEPNVYEKENNSIKEKNIEKDYFNKRMERNFTETNFFKKPDKFVLNRTISTDLFNKNCYNNRACIFNYQKDDIYIVFGVLSLDLVCYNCNNNYIVNKFILFTKLHKDNFDSVRHFYDSKNYRDLIITSSLDSHVKVINFKVRDSTIILDLNFEYLENVIINTAYFINNEIMIPFAYHNKKGTISFYNLEFGFEINEVKEDPGFVLCLNGYYHEYAKKYYAIVSNTEGIYVYNINDYSLYNRFTPRMSLKYNSFTEGHVIEKDEKVILIGTIFSQGFIFLWNLISKNLIEIITLSNGITDICLWNNNYIFACLNGGMKDKFVLLNLNNKNIEKRFDDIKDNNCIGIKILKHRTEGDFLITFSSSGKLYLYKM